jgi:hypothetical protein
VASRSARRPRSGGNQFRGRVEVSDQSPRRLDRYGTGALRPLPECVGDASAVPEQEAAQHSQRVESPEQPRGGRVSRCREARFAVRHRREAQHAHPEPAEPPTVIGPLPLTGHRVGRRRPATPGGAKRAIDPSEQPVSSPRPSPLNTRGRRHRCPEYTATIQITSDPEAQQSSRLATASAPLSPTSQAPVRAITTSWTVGAARSVSRTCLGL